MLAFKSLLLGLQQEFSQVLSSRIKIIQTLRSGLGFSLLLSLFNLHLPQLEGLSLYMALSTLNFVSFKHHGFWTTCSGLGPLTPAPNKICTKINDFKEFLLLYKCYVDPTKITPLLFWTPEQTARGYDSVNPPFLLTLSFDFNFIKVWLKYSIKKSWGLTTQPQLRNLSFERLCAYKIW